MIEPRTRASPHVTDPQRRAPCTLLRRVPLQRVARQAQAQTRNRSARESPMPQSPSRAGASRPSCSGRSSDSQARSRRAFSPLGSREGSDWSLKRPVRITRDARAMACKNRPTVGLFSRSRLVTAAGPSRNRTGVPCCVGRADCSPGRPPSHLNQTERPSLLPPPTAVKAPPIRPKIIDSEKLVTHGIPPPWQNSQAARRSSW
jgi:hypothetical protein